MDQERGALTAHKRIAYYLLDGYDRWPDCRAARPAATTSGGQGAERQAGDREEDEQGRRTDEQRRHELISETTTR